MTTATADRFTSADRAKMRDAIASTTALADRNRHIKLAAWSVSCDPSDLRPSELDWIGQEVDHKMRLDAAPMRLKANLMPRGTAIGDEPTKTTQTSDGWTITKVRDASGAWWTIDITRTEELGHKGRTWTTAAATGGTR